MTNPEKTRRTELTASKQRPAHLFKPGQSGNPLGRPRGSRNKLGEAFIAALAEDFERNGAEAITECRERFPGKYLSVVASILPKEIDVAIEADIKHHTDAGFEEWLRSSKGGQIYVYAVRTSLDTRTPEDVHQVALAARKGYARRDRTCPEADEWPWQSLRVHGDQTEVSAHPDRVRRSLGSEVHPP